MFDGDLKLLFMNQKRYMVEHTYCGVDPSLRHGSMLMATFAQADGKLVLVKASQVALWGKINDCSLGHRGVGLDDDAKKISSFGTSLAITINANTPEGCKLFIDWVPGALFGKSSPKLASYMAMIMGAFMAHVNRPYEFVHPSTLRSALGAKPREDKLVVQETFLRHLDPNGQKICSDILREDEVDALILAAYPYFRKKMEIVT